jgi:hypothetical protein
VKILDAPKFVGMFWVEGSIARGEASAQADATRWQRLRFALTPTATLTAQFGYAHCPVSVAELNRGRGRLEDCVQKGL